MAEKKITVGEVAALAQFLIGNWDDHKNEIKLSGRSVYALIGLKNSLMSEFRKLQEATRTVVLAHGGVEQDDGNIKVPDAEIGATNMELAEMHREETTLTFTPIIVTDNDSLPLDFMDALFNFIELK